MNKYHSKKGGKLVKKFLSIIISIMMILSLTACQKSPTIDKETKGKDAKGKNTIVVGVVENAYPWSYMKDSKLEGFQISMWEEISKRNGLEVKFDSSRSESVLTKMLESGEIDTLASPISDLIKTYSFTEPYGYMYYDFLVLNDDNINSLEDLKGKGVVTFRDNDKELLKEVNNALNLGLSVIRGDKDVRNSVQLLEQGNVKGSLEREIDALTIVENSDSKFKVLGDKHIIDSLVYSFPMDYKNKKLIDDVNKTIREMKEDGTIKKLSEQWFKMNIVDKPEERK